MRLGVRGYPCKSDVDELSISVEALVNGAQFVSSRLRHSSPQSDPLTTKSRLSEEPPVYW